MLSLRIALRYLFSRKSHGVVNVISAISVASVAVATAAIVVVLSVFNGFSDLASGHFSHVDPQVMVSPRQGKVIADGDSLASALAALPEVGAACPTLTERGLLGADDRQLGVVFKGVPRGYEAVVDLGQITTIQPGLTAADSLCAPASMAVGVASQLDLRPGFATAELYVPRRVGRVNPANPASAFFSVPLVMEGVLQVEQMEFDADHIVVPLEVARRLLSYTTEATAIELAAADGVSERSLARAVAEAVGPDFVVATQPEQHAESMRMIAVEKWVTFAMLIFILVIAAFNIVSTLSLMVIEKRDNMSTLRYLGAPSEALRGVFMWMGALITLSGGLAGIVLGAALSLAQQWGGFIKLAGDPGTLTVSVYPVRLGAPDLLAVLLILIAMSAVIAAVTRLFTKSFPK